MWSGMWWQTLLSGGVRKLHIQNMTSWSESNSAPVWFTSVPWNRTKRCAGAAWIWQVAVPPRRDTSWFTLMTNLLQMPRWINASCALVSPSPLNLLQTTEKSNYLQPLRKGDNVMEGDDKEWELLLSSFRPSPLHRAHLGTSITTSLLRLVWIQIGLFILPTVNIETSPLSAPLLSSRLLKKL